jgi:family
MKKIGIVFFAAVMFTVFSFARGAGEKQLVIGEVFWGLHDSYQQAHQIQTKAYCDQLGIKFIPMDGQMKPEVQTAAMEDLISRNVDGIICQAYDQASMEIMIKAAQNAGIPVVSFVNISSGEVKYPSVEISEEAGAIEMGKLVGERFKQFFPNKQMKLLTVSDPSIEWAHVQRTQAFLNGLKQKVPNFDYVFNGGKSDRETAYAVMEDVMQRDPAINMVFGYNAENGLGAIAALEAAGRGSARNNVPQTELVVSVDGSTPEILKIMNPNSSYCATLALRPRENAKACVDMLLKIINGKMDMHETSQNVKIASYVINCWDMTISDTEKFLKDEWALEINISKEIGL